MKRLLQLLDGLETGVYMLLGSCLFVVVLVVLPIALARDLFSVQPVLAFILVAICASTLGLALRDLARRKWSFASRVMCAIWVGCVIFVALAG
jgi:hypothetical protein